VKLARFVAGGRCEEGRLVDPGVLLDTAGRRHAEADVTFLPPVPAPAKILGLALNYADHSAELGLEQPKEPAIFFKPATALAGHRGEIVYPAGVEYLHYENELAVVIGRRCRRVRAADALDVVAGYTIANDVTVRDFVTNTFRPPVKAKGWDSFLPLGPYLVRDEIEDPHALGLRTYVNGELRQEGNTRDAIWRVGPLIEWLTEFMTLEAGDVLLTGTPRGLSHLHPGDEVRLEVDGLGALESRVVAEAGERPEEDGWVR
jgi:5-oxopent-3-ene-1,2,5-tricarboxylate decarboxylase/2-hydroxyhepta-2,4-diene-1,7-dioate isomerase